MANITRFDPFNELVDDLFRGFFVRPVFGERAADARVVGFRLDVIDRPEAYVVQAELPGVKKEDIQVSIDGAQVSIAAEVKRELEAGDNVRVLHAERFIGKLSRSFTLPQEADEAKAAARFADGVLELTLPKKAAARRMISIQ